MEKKVASQGLLLFLLVSLLITIEWSLAYIKLESKVSHPIERHAAAFIQSRVEGNYAEIRVHPIKRKFAMLLIHTTWDN